MLNRSDMLELTRRMTPARSSIDRIAGCYFDEEGYSEGSFNTSFLGLSLSDRTKNLKLAKVIPFSEINKQLQEVNFPGETKQSGDMMNRSADSCNRRLRTAVLTSIISRYMRRSPV